MSHFCLLNTTTMRPSRGGSGSSWWKVAAGLEKVFQEAARQSAQDASKVSAGAAHHALDLWMKASKNGGELWKEHQQENHHQEDLEKMVKSNRRRKSPVNGSETPLETKELPRMLIHATEESTARTETDYQTSNILTSKSSIAVPTEVAANADLSSEPTERQSASDDQDTKLDYGRKVPSTRVGRAWGFAQLGMQLALGTAVQGAQRLVSSSDDKSSSAVVNDRNADVLAASLCRMRGAALKLGQMLSIQDQSLLPPPLTRALKQVRQGAESMPASQLQSQLVSQLGTDWRKEFDDFTDRPFAAASIGQCHRATLHESSTKVVVKVQYPGVAQSIESDLRNLGMLVQFSGLAPKGLFLENVLRVGSAELRVECDYQREAKNQKRFQELIHKDDVLREHLFYVPEAYRATDQVLITEYCPGGTIDTVSDLPQDERDRIGRAILYLTMQELFVWRFMQTDPNWGNFLYDHGTRRTSLIDFGACREYSREFVDGYLRIVWASANQDEATLLDQSHRMKFLTGEENDAMVQAHIKSGFTVGEPFWNDEPFDFRGSQISARMGEHTSVFLKHRLTAPPTEVYTLHRKLAGAYMLCIRLGSVISVRDLLADIVRNHEFADGLSPPEI